MTVFFLFVKKGGGKLAKLTLKQQKFADEYIISGKYGSVYCIENRINNKKYIGITTRSLQKRFKEHCKAESVIGRAIRKHKKENFIYYELERVSTKKELFELEKYYIAKYKTFKNGYNSTIGGDGVVYDNSLDVILTKKQTKFVGIVESENKKNINIKNSDEIFASIILNLCYFYLTSDTKMDKRDSAIQLLKLKDDILIKILSWKLFSLAELRRWKEWRSTPSG